ncbi:unnamed protein product [Protopolystoma xenopodis]|uniref:Uncharacterized protein n=1 Tax=Protopolystoma xenopodis TaxID=117903 RepID=A0A3S5AKD7_9PLAT|nr:unnamed protein product [Protopolystoma xenopodis]
MSLNSVNSHPKLGWAQLTLMTMPELFDSILLQKPQLAFIKHVEAMGKHNRLWFVLNSATAQCETGIAATGLIPSERSDGRFRRLDNVKKCK